MTCTAVETMRPKLDVGAGPYRRDEDFITVDPFFDESDVKANAWELPFDDGRIEEIWCSHVLEHMEGHRVVESLKEFLRVLRPGGLVNIAVPNFDYIARYWLTGPDRQWAQQMIYGQQFHAGEYHKTAFYPEILDGTLKTLGFDKVRVEHRWTHNQDTLLATAVKPSADV